MTTEHTATTRTDSQPSAGSRAEARRAIEGLVGTALLAGGFQRRSLQGGAMAVAGAGLLTRAVGGPSRLRAALGRDGEPAGETESAAETSVGRAVTVGKPAEELYAAWRDPETFSRVMDHVADVSSVGENRFQWTVHGPYGRDIGWESHVVESEPGSRLRWETPTDAVLPNEGEVRFEPAPGDRGTTVTLSVSFDPPGGTLGAAALEQFDIAPAALAGVALDRFKSLAESGEIPTLEGNPSARGSGDVV